MRCELNFLITRIAAVFIRWRVKRHIFYAVEIDSMRRLLGFLTEDCCQGQPEICGPLPLRDSFCKT